MLGEGSQVGDKCSVKRSVIGRHCRIGSNVKVTMSFYSCQPKKGRWCTSLKYTQLLVYVGADC